MRKHSYSPKRCVLCGAYCTTMTFEALMNMWHCSNPELCGLTLTYERMMKDVESA